MSQFRKNADGSLKWPNPLSIVGTPDAVALARTVDSSISSSTEITLNKATSYIRVYAIAKDVYLKWGTDDVTDSNFDEVIPAGQVFDFLVPDGETAINVIQREATASVIIIEK
ncbi:MAG: hypothetical protein WC346_04345 [Methanogenium sp.]|jgi:hypothetical protein